MTIKDLVTVVNWKNVSLEAFCLSTIIFACLLCLFSKFGKRGSIFDNIVILYLIEVILQMVGFGIVLFFWGETIIEKIIWWRGAILLSLLVLVLLGLFVLLPMVTKPKRWFWFCVIMCPLQIILSVVVLGLFIFKV